MLNFIFLFPIEIKLFSGLEFRKEKAPNSSEIRGCLKNPGLELLALFSGEFGIFYPLSFVSFGVYDLTMASSISSDET